MEGSIQEPGSVERIAPRVATKPVVLALGLIALVLVAGGAIRLVDNALYDAVLRTKALRTQVTDTRFVLVEIDEASIERLGRFPWDRSVFADLTRKMSMGEARIVGYDVIFSESAGPDDDAFAAALRESRRVVLSSVAAISEDWEEEDPPTGDIARLRRAEQMIEPIPLLSVEAAAVGHASVLEDGDGSLRDYPLLVRNQGRPYPSLAMAMASTGASNSVPATRPAPDGSIRINYGNMSPAAVVRVSAADVLDLDEVAAKELFSEKIVFVGATYAGGTDVGPTPLAIRTPRVYGHIYALNTILTGEYLLLAPAFLTWIVAFGMLLLLRSQLDASHPLRALGRSVVFLAGLVGVSLVLFWSVGIVFLPMLPVAAGLFFLTTVSVEQWWRNLEERTRAEAFLDRFLGTRMHRKAMFGAHAQGALRADLSIVSVGVILPPEVESGADATEAVAMLSGLFSRVEKVVADAGGEIDHVTGEGVTAFWGYPAAIENAPVVAIQAALDIQTELRKMNAGLRKAGASVLRVSIGVRTGTAILADVGRDGMPEITLAGREAQLAHRFCDLAPLGGIVVGARTRDAIEDIAGLSVFPHETIEHGSFSEPIETFRVERPYRAWVERDVKSRPGGDEGVE